MTRFIEVFDTEKRLRVLVNVSLIRTIYPTYVALREENGCIISLRGAEETSELLVEESYAQVRDSIIYLNGMVRIVKDTVAV